MAAAHQTSFPAAAGVRRVRRRSDEALLMATLRRSSACGRSDKHCEAGRREE